MQIEKKGKNEEGICLATFRHSAMENEGKDEINNTRYDKCMRIYARQTVKGH